MMMDDDEPINNDDDAMSSSTSPQAMGENFTQIQSRKFRSNTLIPCWSFCPSMDLVLLGTTVGTGQTGLTGHLDGLAGLSSPDLGHGQQTAADGLNRSNDDNGLSFGVSNVAESIAVHRITSWQRLLTLNANQLTLFEGNAEDEIEDSGPNEDLLWDFAQDGVRPSQISSNSHESLLKGATSICWSPDGRCVAIGLAGGGVLLHNVEPETDESGGYGGGGASGGGDGDAAGGQSALHVIRLPPSCVVANQSIASNTANVETSSHLARSSAPKVQTEPTVPSALPNPPSVSSAAQSKTSKTKQVNPLFSPRVTRSMAAKREKQGETKSKSTTSKSDPPKPEQPQKRPQHEQSPSDPVTEIKSVIEVSQNDNVKSDVDNNNIKNTESVKHRDDSDSSAVLGLTWNRALPLHTPHNITRNEWETMDSWIHRSKFTGKQHCFLPLDSSQNVGFRTNDPLGVVMDKGMQIRFHVLCVATKNELHWYLHGRYRIISIPHFLNSSKDCPLCPTKLVCSPDLSAVLAVRDDSTCINSSKKTNRAMIISVPHLSKKRFHLQVLSTSYRSIFSHLKLIQRGIQSSLVSWQSALRPLDNKFNALLRLLKSYQVSPPANGTNSNKRSEFDQNATLIRKELLQFILSGRSTISGETCNALDQFFTGPQMHDQLFQREARGVEASLASLEESLRNNVLLPVRRVVYEAEELYGIARTPNCSKLIAPSMALRLYTATRILYLLTEKCLGRLVVARSHIHDLLGWIRGTAAQVRARGTALDSIQRGHARDRRVPNGVLKRVVECLSSSLSSSMSCDSDGKDEGSTRKLTECIIGIPLSDYFVGKDFWSQDAKNATLFEMKQIYSLKTALQVTFCAGAALFDHPRQEFSKSARCINLKFEREHSVMAIHTRIGGDFFTPQISAENDFVGHSRYWFICARSLEGRNRCLEIIAIPSGCDEGNEETYEISCSNATNGFKPSYFLRSVFSIPHKVVSIAFYSDESVSPASMNSDNTGESKRGRQSLGLVVEIQDSSSASNEREEELWIFPYDDVLFHRCEFKSKSESNLFVHDGVVSEGGVTMVDIVSNQNFEIGGRANNKIVPKRRRIQSQSHHANPERTEINLNGSRGIGGVITFDAATSLDIFDLEEDDDADDCSESADAEC